MGQFFFPDNLPPIVKASTTALTLAATHLGMPTRVSLGGQQYRVDSALTCDLASSGAGGLDTGSLGSDHELYFVYAVLSLGSIALIASLSAPSTGPSGFSVWQLVGVCYANSGLGIGSTVTISGAPESEWWEFDSSGLWVGFNQGASPTNRGYQKREGDTLHVEALLTLGTGGTGTGNLAFTLPDGLVIDTTKLQSTSIGAAVMGYVRSYDSNTTLKYNGLVGYQATTRVNFHPENGGSSVWRASAPFTWADSDQITMRFDVPIVGWSNTPLKDL